MMYILQQMRVVVPLVAIVSASAGAGGALLVMRTRLEKKYAALAEQQIKEAEDALALRYKVGAYSGLVDYEQPKVEQEDVAAVQEIGEEQVAAAVQALTSLAEQEGYTPYSSISERPAKQEPEERIEVMASQRRSVFDDQAVVELEDFDQDAEDTKKAANLPYVMVDDIYYTNAENLRQYQFTYYEADDVLLNELDEVVTEDALERNIGRENLRFGYGSTNKNTVLVHNPYSNVGFEITRNKGSYAKDFFGMDDSPDDDEPAVRKMRPDF